jgi:hypothetical protein
MTWLFRASDQGSTFALPIWAIDFAVACVSSLPEPRQIKRLACRTFIETLD